ncbi:hypothetical protein [Streptomyces sp. NPDC059479]|uniref:hypothetical protein n=1 Tax=Streptomyces sp. NPDC059479 TaxID=3346848 RepID=UPI003674E29A
MTHEEEAVAVTDTEKPTDSRAPDQAEEPAQTLEPDQAQGPIRTRTPRRLPAQPWLRAALALSGWVALAATALPGGSPLRWLPVLLFVTFGPGFALLLPRTAAYTLPGARLETVALAAPLSLSLAALTATALFLVEGYSVTLFLVSLAAFCTVVAPLPAVPLPAASREAASLRAAERLKPGPWRGR